MRSPRILKSLKNFANDADWAFAFFVAIATLGSAWCALQSSIWGGVQTFHLANSGSANRQAIFAQNEANQERLMDAMVFFNLGEAYLLGEGKLVDFYLKGMPATYSDSLKGWYGRSASHRTRTLTSIMDSFVVHEESGAKRLQDSSESERQVAEKANHTSDAYVLVTVLFASALFCSGMGSKSKTPALQKFFLISAAFVITVAIIFMFSNPVSFGAPVGE